MEDIFGSTHPYLKTSSSYIKLGRLIFFLLLVTFFTNPGIAQKSKAEEIESVATELFEADQNYGGILIVESDEIIYNNAFGMSDKAAKTPNSGNSLFQINSLTQNFTAVLILQLYEKGLIKLNDPISL